MENGGLDILIIVVILLFLTFLIAGWPPKRKSSFTILIAVIGLLLLPVAHIIESIFVVEIANEAIKQCTMDQGELVGHYLSENLGIFGFIGESIEEQLNQSYSEDIMNYLTKAIEYRKWPQILMYASLIAIFIDLFCLYNRSSDSKIFLLFMRLGFTFFVGFLIYSGVTISYGVAATRLNAKTYGLFELLGASFGGYTVGVALLSTALYVVPLLLLHIVHYKCANRYFENENDYLYNQPELAPVEQPSLLPHHFQSPQVPVSPQAYIEPTTPNTSATGATIEQLDELLHAGILTEEEYDAEVKNIMPHSDQTDGGENKVKMLRQLKSLFDAEILTQEEYDKQKVDILFSGTLPIWSPEKTKIDILKELKVLLDEGILAQEEFDYQKMDVLESD